MPTPKKLVFHKTSQEWIRQEIKVIIGAVSYRQDVADVLTKKGFDPVKVRNEFYSHTEPLITAQEYNQKPIIPIKGGGWVTEPWDLVVQVKKFATSGETVYEYTFMCTSHNSTECFCDTKIEEGYMYFVYFKMVEGVIYPFFLRFSYLESGSFSELVKLGPVEEVKTPIASLEQIIRLHPDLITELLKTFSVEDIIHSLF